MTVEEIEELRLQVKSDLLVCFNELKKISLIVGLVLAPWIPAYVVKVTIDDQHKIEIAQYSTKMIGSVDAYIDTLATLSKLCDEYKHANKTDLDKTGFNQRFDHYMAHSINRRTDLAANAPTISIYFGKHTKQLVSELSLMTINYGFTPDTYCSHQLLGIDELRQKQHEIYEAAIQDRPFLKDAAP